jgi:hypothetical protein
VRIVYAVLGWWGTATGALWVAVLYGFLKKENWAWFWGAVAATIQLLAGFFPMIPALDGGLPTPTLIVFILAAVLWFGMLFIGGIPKRIISLTFIAGLAYVLTFIDGVAPISKYQTSAGFWNGVYAISQQVNWWGAAAWAVFILATFKRKPWAMPWVPDVHLTRWASTTSLKFSGFRCSCPRQSSAQDCWSICYCRPHSGCSRHGMLKGGNCRCR